MAGGFTEGRTPTHRHAGAAVLQHVPFGRGDDLSACPLLSCLPPCPQFALPAMTPWVVGAKDAGLPSFFNHPLNGTTPWDEGRFSRAAM